MLCLYICIHFHMQVPKPWTKPLTIILAAWPPHHPFLQHRRFQNFRKIACLAFPWNYLKVFSGWWWWKQLYCSALSQTGSLFSVLNQSEQLKLSRCLANFDCCSFTLNKICLIQLCDTYSNSHYTLIMIIVLQFYD